MKKIISVLLILILSFSLCACGESKNTIETDYDSKVIYYNGYTYILNDFYSVDTDNAECVQLFSYVSNSGHEAYYGNDKDCPDYIYHYSLWLREDLCIDRDTPLTLWRCWHDDDYLELSDYEFTISEVTTGEVVRRTLDNDEDFDLLYSFDVKVTPYSAVYQGISIYEMNGVFYMAEDSDSDYYEITREFYDEVKRIVPPYEPV